VCFVALIPSFGDSKEALLRGSVNSVLLIGKELSFALSRMKDGNVEIKVLSCEPFLSFFFLVV
jgi:hypothetical protein